MPVRRDRVPLTPSPPSARSYFTTFITVPPLWVVQ
jgi:hypothetical protein